MTPSTSRTINSLIFKSSAGTSSWSGLLIALLFCAFLIPGCSKSSSSNESLTPLEKAIANLESLNHGERETAVLNLKELEGGDGDDAASKVVELLKDDKVEVRTAAIGYLVHYEKKSAAAEVAAVAGGDADANVKTAAIEALVTLDPGKLIELCVGYLTGDDANQQASAANILQSVEVGAGEGAQAALVSCLQSSKSPDTRSQCIYALANLGAKATAETKAALQAASSDADKTVAEAAKTALEDLN